MTTEPELADLDGPIGAPDHHHVVFENERVRVFEVVIRVGDTTPLHTHLTPHALVFSSGSHLVRRDASGAVLLDTRTEGPDFVLPRYSWSDGQAAHTLENVGSDDILATAIELKA
jgi:hypothetical protein